MRDDDDLNMVEAYRAANLPEAYAIYNALADAGITAQLDGELLQGAVGELPIGWSTAPRIMVEESQRASALRIIERVNHLRARASEDQLDEMDDQDSLICLSCRTTMTELDAKCPECGWSYQENDGAFRDPRTELRT